MALDYDIEYAIQDMRENSLYETAPYWARVTECILRGKKDHARTGTVQGDGAVRAGDGQMRLACSARELLEKGV